MASDLPADWTYDTPAQPLPRPAWMEKAILFEAGTDHPFIDMEKTQVSPWLKRLLDAGFVPLGYYSNAFCRIVEPKEGDAWVADCHAEVNAMHAAGMKVLAGIYPVVGERNDPQILIDHPEWRLRRGDAMPGPPGSPEPWSGLGCLVSPYGQLLADRLVARMAEFHVDGFHFDGWYQMDYCRCDGCRTLYKQESGLEIPTQMDQRDINYRKYLTWRNKKLLERFLYLRDKIKALNPEAVLMNWNNNSVNETYPSWMPEQLNCYADWTNKEWWDSYDVYSIWTEKRLRGSAGDIPSGIASYTFMRAEKEVASGVWHGSSCPMPEVLYRMHEIMAMGSFPIIWSSLRAGWKNPEDMDRVTQDWIDYLPYVQQTRSLKYAACLDSYTSFEMLGVYSDFSSRRIVEESLAHQRGGVARALIEEHVPFDVIGEHNLTSEILSQYRVLILPNTFCMSDRVLGVVRDFVAHGGGLVATFETSLRDGWGQPRQAPGQSRPDFALADLFGAHYLGSTTDGPSRIGFTTATAHAITDDPSLRDLMGSKGLNTYWGKYAHVEATTGTVRSLSAIDVSVPKATPTPVPEDAALAAAVRAAGSPAPASPAEWSPLLLSEKGPGRVAYFPAAIDAAYYDAGYPYQRKVFANAVRWAAGAPPSITIRAPMCVMAGFFTKEVAKEKSAGKGTPATRQVIVHLLNGINSTTGHGSKDEKQYAFREEVVPISDVAVTFAGPKPERIFLVPGGGKLKAHETPEGWQVTIARLDLHSVVVAEYRD